MITLLYGSNRLAVEERLQEIRTTVDASGVNTTSFDNASQNLTELRAACGAPGFFGNTRLIIAKDLFTSRKPSRSRRAKAGDSEDDPHGLLIGVPDTTHLIVVEENIDTNTEKGIRKVVPNASFERHDVPRGRELVNWASARARRYGSTLPSDVAASLLEALFPGSWQAAGRRDDLPPNLFRLDGEISKLATAAGEGQSISTTHVAELVPEAEAQNIWGLTDAIAAGNAAAAVLEAERALAHGTPAELLIAQLAAQFEAFAALATPQGTRDMSAAASATGLTEGRLRQASRTARRFPASRVSEALTVLRTVDADAKQGRAEPADSLIAAVARIAAGS